MGREKRNLEIIPAAIVCLLLAAVALLSGCRPKTPTLGPPEVVVAEVQQKDVPIVREWVGTLSGNVNAEIRPKTEGYVLKQLYTGGSLVRKGQPLFQIDPRQYKAAYDDAKGNLDRQKAHLEKADNDVARYTPLAQQKAVSQEELDNALSAQREARANLASAQASLDNAKANLDWTTLVSPVDGIAGLSNCEVGELVNGQSLLTTVSSVDPIQVFFQLSEQDYMRAMRSDVKGTFPEMPLELVLADETVYPHKGVPVAADREVNVKTGTITVKGSFPNPGNFLRPGQYAKVRMAVATARGAILVPQRAVTDLQGNPQVAVVKTDNTVDLRGVKLGAQAGNLWVIEDGLKPGELVIVEGLQKVKAGTVVVPKRAGEGESQAPATGR